MSGGDLESRLRATIRAGGLRLNYQPIVSLPSGHPSGAEALARWTDAVLGVVPPDVFIPVAEESGLVHELGRWVLREACSEAMRWSAEPDGPTIAVNVSPVQLVRPDIIVHVAEALAESRLTPGRLCLEITETAAVLDLDVTSARLARLRELGVQIALDDFGTGFSSLTLLRRLPLDLVKIDRSFIAGLHESSEDAVVVRLAVDAAHRLGHRVCAEGVEDVEQLRQLVAMGCDSAQGWYFGRPQADTVALTVVSERLASIAAQESGQDSYLALDNASRPDLVMAIAPDGRIRYASSAAMAMLGRRPEDLVGRILRELLHPGDAAPGADGGRPADASQVRRVRHANGDYRWMSSSVHQLRDEQGAVREYVTTSRDITDLIETQKQLEAVEERFRGAFDGSPIGMALSDLSGRIVRINEALADLIGYRPEDLVGRTVDDITLPEDRAADVENLERLATGAERGHRVRKRYVDSSGREVPVEVWAATVDGGDGSPELVVAHVLPVRDESTTPAGGSDHRSSPLT